MTSDDWDGMYRSREQVFSGNPNPVLVAEVSALAPGQALDVGCGEGADAVWLARRGWRVTAVDVSETALRRGAESGRDVAGHIAWTRADVSETALPAAAFELVSVQYFPLPKRDDGALERLLATVAPGGTLLVTGHDPADEGVDYGDYYRPDEIAERLQGWRVDVHEMRARETPGPEGTHHTRDVVLKAIAPQEVKE